MQCLGQDVSAMSGYAKDRTDRILRNAGCYLSNVTTLTANISKTMTHTDWIMSHI